MNQQRRNHFESDTDQPVFVSEPESGSRTESGSGCNSRSGSKIENWSGSGSESGAEPEPPPFRFDKLREGAWDRFLVKSDELATAHRRTNALLQREGGWAFAMIVAFFQRLVAAIRGPMEAEAPQPASAPDPLPQQRTGHHDGPDQSRAGHAQADRAQADQAQAGRAQAGRAQAGRPHVDPARADRTDCTDRADLRREPDGTAREHRTALAVRSTRLASAIRGAQRARTETRGAAASAANAAAGGTAGDTASGAAGGAAGGGSGGAAGGAAGTPRPELRPEARSQSFGAKLIGGHEPRLESFRPNLLGGASWA
jgi:hypothetical protein